MAEITLDHLEFNRQDIVRLCNDAADLAGLGRCTTTTTIQNLVAAGLPRTEKGRQCFYNLATLTAWLLLQRKNKDDTRPAESAELDLERKRQLIRKIKIDNDKREGELIDREQVVSEWQQAGAVFAKRMQALADSQRKIGNDTVAGTIESALAEAVKSIEQSISGTEGK